MKLHLISDIHCEVYRDKGAALLDSLDPTGIDVLVMAGDIGTARYADQLRKVFEVVAAKYPHVVMVPGNHEYYLTWYDVAHQSLKTAASGLSNIHILDANSVVINGRTFHGHTMWYPGSPEVRAKAHLFSDFLHIKGGPDTWIFEENWRWEKYIANNLKKNDIVVTHHLPSYLSVNSKYVGAPSNVFFVCPMDQYIDAFQPALWLHGHTHTQCNYIHTNGVTRIAANPLGYPGEVYASVADYKPLTIELTSL